MSGGYAQNNSNVLNSTADRLSGAQGGATSRLDSALSNPRIEHDRRLCAAGGHERCRSRTDANQASTNVGLQAQAQKDAIARIGSSGRECFSLGCSGGSVARWRTGHGGDGRCGHGRPASSQRAAETGCDRSSANATRGGSVSDRSAGRRGAILGSLGSQNAQYEGGLAQNAVQQQENTRLSANQYLAGQNVNAANQVAANQLQSNQYTRESGASGGKQYRLPGTRGPRVRAESRNEHRHVAGSGERAESSPSVRHPAREHAIRPAEQLQPEHGSGRRSQPRLPDGGEIRISLANSSIAAT
jgi:hypothetical protein